jgi:hypothetical protein
MNKVEKLDNERFFSLMIGMLKEGGVWIWPDENEAYKKVDNKFKPSTPYGYQCLKRSTTKKWFEDNILEP